MELTTTLHAIRKHSPCVEGWERLLRHLGKTQADDESLPFAVILESNGFGDALWCCRSAPQYDREWRLFAVWCARQVQHLMPDPACVAAVDVAEKFANGLASEAELRAARSAADSAVWSAAKRAANAARSASWIAAESAQSAAFRYLVTTGSLEDFQ